MNHFSPRPVSTEREVLRQHFLNAMSRIASTVNVVTTDGPAGRGGVTVTAMSSVSADTERPTMMVCIHKNSEAADKIRDNGVFCINVLGESQSDVSNSFAGRSEYERFSLGDWVSLKSGAPHLANSLAAFDCKVTECKLVGTHFVFFGETQGVCGPARRWLGRWVYRFPCPRRRLSRADW